MPEQADFIRQQLAFAAHIRDPEANPPPGGIEDRRMAIYRELFFNNVEGFLSSGFPVLRQITADDHWQAMARDFFARHQSQTPLFAEISREFLAYLQHERGEVEGDPPFLLELAHYEWVELALSISDADRNAEPADANGDLLSGQPVISPLAWPLSYRYPVHRIGPDYLPDEPPSEPTQLVVHRDRQDEVRFVEINAVTQLLLATLKENPRFTGLDALKAVAAALEHPQPETVINAGSELLADLRQRDIIIGTRP